MSLSKGCRPATPSLQGFQHARVHKSHQSPLVLFILISMKVRCSNVACVPKYSHTDAVYLNESVLPGVSNESLCGISHWVNVTLRG